MSNSKISNDGEARIKAIKFKLELKEAIQKQFGENMDFLLFLVETNNKGEALQAGLMSDIADENIIIIIESAIDAMKK